MGVFPGAYAEASAMNAARSPEVAARQTMPTMSTISIAPGRTVGFYGRRQPGSPVLRCRVYVEARQARPEQSVGDNRATQLMGGQGLVKARSRSAEIIRAAESRHETGIS